MEEITSQYWNILDAPVIDKSTKSFQYNEFKEDNITDIGGSTHYQITIKNSRWKLLSRAFLHVKAKIENQGNNFVTVSNNGINDFRTAQLFYENKEIERIDNLGITTTICNLVDFSGDISDTVASQLFWYMDTNDSANKQRYIYDEANKDTKLKEADVGLANTLNKIKNNPSFNKGFLERWQLTKDGKLFEKFIPLSRIFRFCRDVEKVSNGEIMIKLDKNTDKNILHANVDSNYEYKINYLSLWIPEVEPSLVIQAALEKTLASNKSTVYGWNLVNGYRSTVQSSIDGTWRIVNTQNKVIGIYIIFSKASRQENFKNSLMIFDNMNLQSIHVDVNNKQFPTKPYETNFSPDNLNYMRLYTSFLDAGFKNIDEGTCVSYKDFATLYPIIYFNLTKQEDELNLQSSSTEIMLNWRLGAVPTENYYVYAVVESEKVVNVSIIDKQIFIE
jgi:hypothetical protein